MHPLLEECLRIVQMLNVSGNATRTLWVKGVDEADRDAAHQWRERCSSGGSTNDSSLDMTLQNSFVPPFATIVMKVIRRAAMSRRSSNMITR